MNEQQLEQIFKNMNSEQRAELIKAVSALNLATSVNQDGDFLMEAIDEVSEKYPFVKKFIEG